MGKSMRNKKLKLLAINTLKENKPDTGKYIENSRTGQRYRRGWPQLYRRLKRMAHKQHVPGDIMLKRACRYQMTIN